MTSLPMGCRPSGDKAKDLLLARYLDVEKLDFLDPSEGPSALDWVGSPDANNEPVEQLHDDLGNKDVGNCVLAAPGHMTYIQNQITGDRGIVNRAAAIGYYAALTGYDPASGANDNGTVPRDMLDFWMRYGMYGDELRAFVRVDPKNDVEMTFAADCGGGLLLGLDLPETIWGQEDEHGRQVWDVPPGGFNGVKSSGGHMVDFHGAGRMWRGISWGYDTHATREFLRERCFEAWMVLRGNWLRKLRVPNGFAATDLLADAAARGGVAR